MSLGSKLARWAKVMLGAQFQVATACVVISASGCDALVSPGYVGESRLHLSVRVDNAETMSSKGSSGQDIVPALALVEHGHIYFSPTEVRGSYPSFELDLINEPKWPQGRAFGTLTPNSDLALLYIAAAPRNRLQDPLNLLVDRPIHPDCLDGRCDSVPGSRNPPGLCAGGGCDEPKPECTDDTCTVPLSPVGPMFWDEYADFVGFAEPYLVVFSRAALRPGSWAAQRVGAPEGLAAGYHLATTVEPDDAAQAEADDCRAEANAEVLEKYNAEHGTHYGSKILRCLGLGILQGCGPDEVPSPKATKELPAKLAQAQAEHGCLSIAPSIAILDSPAADPITIYVGGDWRTSDRPIPPTSVP